MKAIAAMAENRAIGRNNKLPWIPIKEDFKWFRTFTTNKILVVGRKTFSTLPFLRDRNIIVLCRDKEFRNMSLYNASYNMGCCALYYDEIVNLYNEIYLNKDKLIIAGGAKTYELFMPHITEFYVTHIKGEYEADTFMPQFEQYFSKKQIIRAFNERLVIFSSSDDHSIEEETLKEVDGHYVIKYSK
jgi:dihydrofolate reductase